MGRSKNTTLRLAPVTGPCAIRYTRLRRTAELSILASLMVLDLWRARAVNDTHGILLLCTAATLLSILATTLRYATQAIPNDQPGLNGCLASILGAFVAALGIRLARNVGGYEASSQAKLDAIAIILTTSIMRLAGIQARLTEPSMQTLRGMFLAPDFFVPVMIVCFMTYQQVADFGCPANILVLQAAEFGLALIMDWAHIKTAIGPGQVAQGTGHIRRRRRGGGEANLPNLDAQPDSE